MVSIVGALKHRYIKGKAKPANTDASAVVPFLNSLGTFSGQKSLLYAIESEHPGWILSPELNAILLSVDDCSKLIFKLAGMEPSIEEQLRQIVPQIACRIIEQPKLPLTRQCTILTILDYLNKAMLGWIPDLGPAGDELLKKFRETILLIKQPGTNIPALVAEVAEFMKKESRRIKQLEQRMVASETGLLRSQQAKIICANMINLATENNQLTDSLVKFLHNSWCNSIQMLVINESIESEHWQRAEKLTETLIWTYQPIDPNLADSRDKRRHLYRIIEHLPDEIRQVMMHLNADRQEADAILGPIESDIATIVSGKDPDYVTFDPIKFDDLTSNRPSVSKRLLRKVDGLNTGQWFTYEEGDTSIRIKLVLKLDDVRQLLFTDRNGMKVLQKTYDEFAYYLSSRVVKSLHQESVFSSTFRTYYQGLMHEYDKHQKIIEERRIELELLDKERQQARDKALKEAQQIAAERKRQAAEKKARLAAAKAEAEKSENAQDAAEFTEKVNALNTGAHLLLPDLNGVMEECKLAVRLVAADKMIFVTRSGTKIGEYSTAELVKLLLAGEARIDDKGVEFEDILVEVVSRLRRDREKSYDDLTNK